MYARPGTRREFLMTVAAGAAALGLASALRAASDKAKRPNFLWISCEDMSPDLGCYGDEYARSPNLDKLASQGRRYTHAFVPFPVCAPTRSAVITGVHPGTLGSMHMRTNMKKYECVPPPDVKCFTEYLRAAGYYCSNHTKTDYQFAPPFTAWDAPRGDWRNQDRPKDAPFFSVVNFTTTHESKCWKIDKLDHDPAKATVPAYYPDTPIIRRNLARYYDNITTMDEQAGALLAKLEADGLADNTVVFFWGDHGRGLPRCKRWPHDSGLRVPLIVRWSGKIAPGVSDELVNLIDLAPTLLSLAGLEPPPAMQGRILLGDKRQPPPPYVFGGRNRMDLDSDDFIRTCRDQRYRYIRNFTPDAAYAQPIPYRDRMPIMKEWRRLHAEGQLSGAPALFFQPKPAEEFYDCESDPDEVRNLAKAPEHQARLKQMRAALDAWMNETNDLGGLPEEELIERMWPGKVQPVTAAPVITIRRAESGKALVTLACETKGASLGYRIGKEKSWRLYAKPFPADAGIELTAQAIRIGYKPSAEVTKQIED